MDFVNRVVNRRVITRERRSSLSELDAISVTDEDEKANNDIHKSLETIIAERRIKGSISQNGHKNGISPLKREVVGLDPFTHSLDEIITAAKKGDQAVEIGKRKRSNANDKREQNKEALKEDAVQTPLPKPILSPYRAVTFLSEQGMVIEILLSRLKEGADFSDKSVRSRLWRCEVNCGAIQGKCASERKSVARELACVNFLANLKKANPEGQLPKYEVPETLLIDPRIFHLLAIAGNRKSTEVNHELVMKITDNKLRKSMIPNCKYVATYRVDGEEYVGESTDPESAKLIAAKAAYEDLSGREFTPSTYFIGDKCPTDLEYECKETELFQILGKMTKDDNYLDFPNDAINPEAINGVYARRLLESKFQREQEEEEARRRNMPISLADSTTAMSESSEITSMIFISDPVGEQQPSTSVQAPAILNPKKKKKVEPKASLLSSVCSLASKLSQRLSVQQFMQAKEQEPIGIRIVEYVPRVNPSNITAAAPVAPEEKMETTMTATAPTPPHRGCRGRGISLDRFNRFNRPHISSDSENEEWE